MFKRVRARRDVERIHSLAMVAVGLWSLVINSPARAEETSVPSRPAPSSLPAWRLQVSPLGTSDTDVALGVYRGLGRRWDLGVEVAGRIQNQDHDSEDAYGTTDSTSYTSHGTTEDRPRSLELAVDPRWWRSVDSRLNVFLSLRLGVQRGSAPHKSWSFSSNDSSASEYASESRNWNVDAAPGFGADLVLLDRLSLLVVFRPIGLRYSDSKYEYTQERTSPPGWTEPRRSETHNTNLEFRTGLRASLFLTLHL